MLNLKINFSRADQLNFISMAMKSIQQKVGKSARKMSTVMADRMVASVRSRINHFYAPRMKKRLPIRVKYIPGTYNFLARRSSNLYNSITQRVTYTRKDLKFNIFISSNTKYAGLLHYGGVITNHNNTKIVYIPRPFMEVGIKNVIRNYKKGNIK